MPIQYLVSYHENFFRVYEAKEALARADARSEASYGVLQVYGHLEPIFTVFNLMSYLFESDCQLCYLNQRLDRALLRLDGLLQIEIID